MTQPYQPQDSMSLWWLVHPQAPQRIGDIRLQDNHRKVGLRYDSAWMTSNQGFALSEDLPLHAGLHVPADKDTAAGAVDDARPDQWGERVIRLIERPVRLSLLEYLYFTGDDRFGALGVSLLPDAYVPAPSAALPTFDTLAAMQQAVQRVMLGEAVNESQRRLLQPGVSMGGARPKSLMQIDGDAWVVKFAESDDMDTPLIEHATMQLARRCGIQTAETRLLSLPSKTSTKKIHAVAIKRFDRLGPMRVHVLSAHVALRAAGEDMGYPELAQLLRRLARPEEVRVQQHELFRRMVFNILMDNTDDHEKNHALVRNHEGHYTLSPAFDVLPSVQGLGYQQMRVGSLGHAASMDNALSEANAFGLTRDAAKQMVALIAAQVAQWQAHFKTLNMSHTDIDKLAHYLDGSNLKMQRKIAQE